MAEPVHGEPADARETRRRTSVRRRSFRPVLLGGGHLAALWAVAVAHPLLDLLGRNPVFFAVRGSTPREIVLFALALTLLPPLLLTAVEALAELASGRLRSAVHLLFVGALAALLALYAGKRALESSGGELLVGAALVGLAVAAAYELVPAVRFAATLFLPVPLVVLALFLLASPAARLVLIEEAAEARAGEIRSRAPVVLVIFDELPTVSLLNGREEIDARRFPGFGAVAAEATWYRSATTVSSATETAVPAILTGTLPEKGELPFLVDHPNNLFTFLRASHELAVALNGRIAAVTRTTANGSSFAALLPDGAFVEGANDLRVYAVRTGPSVTLEELEGLELELTLREAEGRIDVSGAEPIAVADGPLEGEVRVRFQAGVASLRGWAADRRAGTPAERVIVFAGDEAVFAGRPGNGGGEDERAGVDGAGFVANVQAALLPRPRSETPVRVFAVAGGVAVELRYGSPFPWRTGAPDKP